MLGFGGGMIIPCDIRYGWSSVANGGRKRNAIYLAQNIGQMAVGAAMGGFVANLALTISF